MLVVSYLCTYLPTSLVLIVTYLPSVGCELPMYQVLIVTQHKDNTLVVVDVDVVVGVVSDMTMKRHVNDSKEFYLMTEPC